VVLTA